MSPCCSVAIIWSWSSPARDGLQPSKLPCHDGNNCAAEAKGGRNQRFGATGWEPDNAYRPHQLLLIAARDSHTPRTFTFPKDGVLRSPQGCLRGVRGRHLHKGVAESLALLIEQDVHTIDRVAKPSSNSRWGDVLQPGSQSSCSHETDRRLTQGTLSMRNTAFSSLLCMDLTAATGVEAPCARSKKSSKPSSTTP